MKLQKRKKFIKGNLICGIILLLTGTILELYTGITTIFQGNIKGINLNLTEINTSYNNKKDPLVKEVVYNDDPSWAFPTSTNYNITSSYSNYHPAIDIVTTDGNTNVYAANSGVIVTDSYKWDGGNYLVLQQDNGYYTLYCHLSSKTVTVGQRVEKGQIIGIMGRTGFATGVHLHFSVWNGYPYENSTHINPFDFY